MKLNPFRVDPAHPFQLAKFLSASSLVLILAFSVAISVFMTNYAKRVLLKKNNAFGLVLAENLNHQIYRRFTLPVVLGFGRVELKRSDQYERLEQVVESTIHSFHVLDVRVYDAEGEVVYATDKDTVGRTDLDGPAVEDAVVTGAVSFVLENDLNLKDSFFSWKLEPGQVRQRTTYPLRAEQHLNFRQEPGPLLGVLEFSQDITNDYQTVLQFQRLVILTIVLCSAALYMLILFLIRKADRILAERVHDKERLERELVQNEKLASMGRMVASIAHEIRNPLGIIRSSAELLRKKETDPTCTRARILEAIFEEAKRLSQTVTDFLDYARPRQPAMEEVDLYRIVLQAIGFLTQQGEPEGVHLESLLPDPYLVRGDRELLYRALYNLISNALQACQGQGMVQVRPYSRESRVGVLITDTGPGFESALLDRYVEPFFTTKDEGTGLGLAITRSIFRSHGAEMFLQNNDQGGEVLLLFSEKNTY